MEMIPFAGIDTLAGAESDKVWTVFEALGTVPTASPEFAAFPAVSPASKDSMSSFLSSDFARIYCKQTYLADRSPALFQAPPAAQSTEHNCSTPAG